MCLSPKIPKDNSAAQARAQEQERQGKITQGQASIDQDFSQFNDPYYNGVEQSYKDYYNPQLGDKYKNALDKLTYNLGRQGILQSSEADRQFGDLQKAKDLQERNLTDSALGAKNSQKANIEQQKNALYSLNTSSADPSLVSSRAQAAITGLNVPPTYSPLGDVFASFINSGANQIALQQAGYPGAGLPIPRANWNNGSGGGSGSSYIVNGG